MINTLRCICVMIVIRLQELLMRFDGVYLHGLRGINLGKMIESLSSHPTWINILCLCTCIFNI